MAWVQHTACRRAPGSWHPVSALLVLQLLVLLSSSSVCHGRVPSTAQGVAAGRALHASDPTQLSAGSTLYCTLTGECKVCTAKHLKSEACRATGFAEHVSCWLRQEDVDGPVIVVTAPRALSTEHLPIHMPRSCTPAPSSASNSKTAASLFTNNVQAGDNDAIKITDEITGLSGPSSNGGNTSGRGASAEQAGSGSSTATSQGQRLERMKLMPDEAHYLSTITFEACMVVLLACSLPVVYWRKAKLRRPG